MCKEWMARKVLARKVLISEVSDYRGLTEWMVWRWALALGQQRNDDGGCAKDRKEWSNPLWLYFTYVTECVSQGHFCLALCPFGPPYHALVGIIWRAMGCRCTMRLWWTVKMALLLKTKALVSSICANGCMLNGCMCVIWLDMTTPPWWREKVKVYYYFISTLP